MTYQSQLWFFVKLLNGKNESILTELTLHRTNSKNVVKKHIESNVPAADQPISRVPFDAGSMGNPQ